MYVCPLFYQSLSNFKEFVKCSCWNTIKIKTIGFSVYHMMPLVFLQDNYFHWGWNGFSSCFTVKWFYSGKICSINIFQNALYKCQVMLIMVQGQTSFYIKNILSVKYFAFVVWVSIIYKIIIYLSNLFRIIEHYI